jgi:hypothetical protein
MVYTLSGAQCKYFCKISQTESQTFLTKTLNFLYVILSNILKVSETSLKSLVLSYTVLFIIFIIEYSTLFQAAK